MMGATAFVFTLTVIGTILSMVTGQRFVLPGRFRNGPRQVQPVFIQQAPVQRPVIFVAPPGTQLDAYGRPIIAAPPPVTTTPSTVPMNIGGIPVQVGPAMQNLINPTTTTTTTTTTEAPTTTTTTTTTEDPQKKIADIMVKMIIRNHELRMKTSTTTTTTPAPITAFPPQTPSSNPPSDSPSQQPPQYNQVDDDKDTELEGGY